MPKPKPNPKQSSANLSPADQPISYQLLQELKTRGLSAYAAAKLCSLDHRQVSRFMSGERPDIRIETADALAAGLGMRLVIPARKGRRPNRSQSAAD